MSLHLPVSLKGAFLINYLSSFFCLTLLLFLPAMTALCLSLICTRGVAMLLVVPLLAAFLLMVTALTHQFQGWLAALMVNTSLESRYAEVQVRPDQIAAARELKPIQERQVFGRNILLFQDVDRKRLAALGDVRTPSIAELFVAVIGNPAAAAQGVAQ